MPSFHPMNAYGQYHLPPPEHGMGYLPGKYQSHQNRQPFSTYQYNGPNDLGPLLPDPFDQHKNPAAQSSLFNQPNGYGSLGANIPPPISAPMIPPLRLDNYRFNADQVNNHAERRPLREIQNPPPAKEEKPTGGVAGSNLDYEMEQMVDFVCEMTVGMYELYMSRIRLDDIDLLRSIKPGTQYPSQFRKWVSQVLNATRLPAATILLSLSYFGLRVRKLSAAGQFPRHDRNYYQMLTIAMILGSKFLDDNTFQNKSWAEVTCIPTSELNRDERNWLIDFGHHLHHDPYTPDGYASFEDQWAKFKERFAPSPLPLYPLNTDLHRGRSVRQPQLTPLSLQQQAYPKSAMSTLSADSDYSDRQFPTPTYSPFDPWYPRRSSRDKSPSTAPHTGPNTPEYYGGPGIWGPVDNFGSRQTPYGYGQMPQFTPQMSYGTGYQRPMGYHPSYQSAWNCHGVACQCNSCRQAQLMQPKYGPIVVG